VRRALIGLLAAAAVLLLVALFAGRIARKMPDLEVYWTAAVRVRSAEPLYRVEDLHYQYKYLPAFAILAIPLGLAPLHTAKAIWFAVNTGLIIALVILSVRVLPQQRKPQWMLIAAAIVAMGKFYGHEAVLGQVNALLGVIVLLAVAALRRGREAQAGLLFALAIVVKPYAVIFLPWLAARGKVESIAAAVCGVAAVVLLPAAVYGMAGDMEAHRAWWRTVTDSTAPNLTNLDNVSLAGMYAKWLGAGTAATVLTVVTMGALAALAIAVFVRRRTVPFPEGLEASLLLTCIPLCSPQGWDYVFLLSTPAIAYVVNFEDRLPRVLRVCALGAIATIGLSLYDVMGRAAYAQFMALSIITLCYFVVLAALGVLRLRGAA
jgi:hypothetical protein